MPITTNTIDPGFEPLAQPLSPEADDSEKLKKRVYGWFALSVAVGMALGAFYIGGRVWAAHRTPPVARIIHVVPEVVPTVQASATGTQAAPEVIPSESETTPAEPVQTAAVKAPAPRSIETSHSALPVTTAAAAPLPADWKVVEPQAGQTYLQLMALARRPAEKYVPELVARGLRPLIAAGPSDGIFRVLIGPFGSHDALEKARRDLVAGGIEPFERAY